MYPVDHDLFFEKTLRVLPEELAAVLRRLSGGEQCSTQEIRLRTNRPLSVVLQGESRFVAVDGRTLPMPDSSCCIVTAELLEQCFLCICAYSVHSHEEEIRHGFVTTRWGDRAGICASAVRNREGTLTYRDISSINLRIAREALGAARGVLRLVDPKKGLLIAGMPSSGKTTLLRDAIRTISSGETGKLYKVAVADERYELSASGQGTAGYDLGLCTDVICGQTKAEAIEQAVRTLSPDIIACDEIGSEQEIQQLSTGLCCGAAFFATVHCGNRDELFFSTRVRRLMSTGAFGYLLLLDSPKHPARVSTIITAEEYDAKADRVAAAV
ncbi:MAG: hypothetical protein RR022_04475 [Angelakisella sp.]